MSLPFSFWPVGIPENSGGWASSPVKQWVLSDTELDFVPHSDVAEAFEFLIEQLNVVNTDLPDLTT